jgi:hypothetical protein
MRRIQSGAILKNNVDNIIRVIGWRIAQLMPMHLLRDIMQF